ncbi:hypothetical protein PR048_011029 [Dryococelus australis]|uniref:Uncharacterized protein n=1 Tax=Dryococelus australis TaxID=614101 RepID=A0ABQ9HKF2_9NEOP|nr:hypothetical protein PR048_011029 [Dryococelus australis]
MHQHDVLVCVDAKPHMGNTRNFRFVGISKMSELQRLCQRKFPPYHVALHQALHEESIVYARLTHVNSISGVRAPWRLLKRGTPATVESEHVVWNRWTLHHRAMLHSRANDGCIYAHFLKETLPALLEGILLNILLNVSDGINGFVTFNLASLCAVSRCKRSVLDSLAHVSDMCSVDSKPLGAFGAIFHSSLKHSQDYQFAAVITCDSRLHISANSDCGNSFLPVGDCRGAQSTDERTSNQLGPGLLPEQGVEAYLSGSCRATGEGIEDPRSVNVVSLSLSGKDNVRDTSFKTPPCKEECWPVALLPTPYHPASIGQAEHSHQTITMASHFVNSDKRDWDDWIPNGLLANRATTHRSWLLKHFWTTEKSGHFDIEMAEERNGSQPAQTFRPERKSGSNKAFPEYNQPMKTHHPSW